MLSIRKTEVFEGWLISLKDRLTIRRIQARIDRLAMGNPGDSQSVGSPAMALRIDRGPDHRVYYVQRGDVVVILLCGGDESTQDRDIKSAHAMLSHLDLE